jgi:hypothetical protein
MSKRRILQYIHSQLAPGSPTIYISPRAVCRILRSRSISWPISIRNYGEERVASNMFWKKKLQNAAQEVVDSSTRPQNAC